MKAVHFLYFYDNCGYLDTEWIGNPTKELDVCTVELASSLTNPHHVCRAVIVKP